MLAYVGWFKEYFLGGRLLEGWQMEFPGDEIQEIQVRAFRNHTSPIL
jgi:hypothetical protein